VRGECGRVILDCRVVVAEHRLRDGAIVIGARAGVTGLNRLGELGGSRFPVVLVREDEAQLLMRKAGLRVEAQGLVGVGERLLGLTLGPPNAAPVGIRQSIVGQDANGLVEIDERSLPIVVVHAVDGPVAQRPRGGRRQRGDIDSGFVVGLLVLPLVLGVEVDGAIVVRLGEALGRQGAVIDELRARPDGAVGCPALFACYPADEPPGPPPPASDSA